MKCPFCSHENIGGADECEDCGEDLTAFDGIRPKTTFEKSLMKDTLETLQSSPPTMVTPDTPILKVAELLTKENRAILIMQNETLLGIVTERDILFKAMGKAEDLSKKPISEIMTPQPETLESTDKIAYAINKMSIGGFRHIPVTKGGKLYRLIGVRDILAYLAEMFPDAVGIHQ